MKSIKRCIFVITLFVMLFIAGMGILIFKIQKESGFYILNSSKYELGKVYDRRGDVLFVGKTAADVDETTPEYQEGYLIDVGNFIGDDEHQMTNTLVAKNLDKLNNYNFSAGLIREGGKAAIYTTLDHYANRKVYDAFCGNDGCAVAYNYKTGEILICTSLPNLDVTKGYDDIDSFRSGTLLSKALRGTVPGSTQKVSTVIAALEIMGRDKLFSKSYTCTGQYVNKTGGKIDCHEIYGHGTLNIQQAIEKSCNPFFAQLIEDNDMPLSSIKKVYSKLGYAINDEPTGYFTIDGIECEKASTRLTDSYEFTTQWGCIGQGDTLVSPIQLMMWQSAIANGTGKMTMPHLIDHVTDVYGNVKEKAVTQFSEQLFSADNAKTVRQILLTNGANNYTYLINGYTVGVKSGTAQVDEGYRENSLLVGFVDDPDLPVAFCVMIEDKNNTWLTTENIVQVMLDSLSENN